MYNVHVESVKAKLQDSNLTEWQKKSQIMMGITDGSNTDEISKILSEARIPTNDNPSASDRIKF